MSNFIEKRQLTGIVKHEYRLNKNYICIAIFI